MWASKMVQWAKCASVHTWPPEFDLWDAQKGDEESQLHVVHVYTKACVPELIKNTYMH